MVAARSSKTLRPFAITGEFSTTTPGQAVGAASNVSRRSTGASRCNTACPTSIRTSARSTTTSSSISSRPSNSLSPRRPPTAAPGTWGTTGTIQPGVVYMADKWQLAVEAVIPVNGRERSRRRRGRPALISSSTTSSPTRIGKPIFSQSLADVHRSPTMTRILHRASPAVTRLRLCARRPPAFAHAQLEKATPAVGGTVASASEIRLEFSEGVEPKFSKVSVTGPGGAVPLGAAKTDVRQSGCADRADLQAPARLARTKCTGRRCQSTRITPREPSNSP